MNGHLEQRGKGRVWYLTFDTRRDRKGRREQQRVRLGSMAKSHAVAAARKILAQVDNGTWIKADSRLTVASFATQWLTAIKNAIAFKTYVGYEARLKRYVIPAIGDMPLGKVQPRHVLGIYDSMQKKGLSGITQLDTHRILHNMIEYAVRVEQVLTDNVMKRVKAPRAMRRDNTEISEERVQKILESVKGTRLEVPVTVTALTGLRRSELLALKWDRINFERGTLKVAEALEHTRGHGVRVKEPKSRTSRREVPLAPEVIALLKRHKGEQDAVKADAGGAYCDLGLVFPNPDGTVWPPDSFSVQFGKLARRAGCPGFRMHDLRHGFATLTLASGVSIRDVSSLLGRSSPGFTLATYTHAMEPTGRAAVGNLAKTLLAERTRTPGDQTVTKSPKDALSA